MDSHRFKEIVINLGKFLLLLAVYIVFVSFLITGFVILSDKVLDTIAKKTVDKIENKSSDNTVSDSLAAIMSIIVETNRVLVDEQDKCQYYVLVKTKIPKYSKSNKPIKIGDTDDLFLWIPVDYNTYNNCSIGGDLATPDLVIGDKLYNGDIENISLMIISKDIRNKKKNGKH